MDHSAIKRTLIFPGDMLAICGISDLTTADIKLYNWLGIDIVSYLDDLPNVNYLQSGKTYILMSIIFVVVARPLYIYKFCKEDKFPFTRDLCDLMYACNALHFWLKTETFCIWRPSNVWHINFPNPIRCCLACKFLLKRTVFCLYTFSGNPISNKTMSIMVNVPQDTLDYTNDFDDKHPIYRETLKRN